MDPEDTPTLDMCSPFVPPGAAEAFRAEWRTETVLGLVAGVEADRAFERLPILADALEEAGCDVPAVLNHCRDAISHDSHCWLLPLVAGREPDAERAALEREVRRIEERLAVLHREQEHYRALIRQGEELERELIQLRRRNRRRKIVLMLIGGAIGVLIGRFVSDWLAEWLFGPGP